MPPFNSAKTNRKQLKTMHSKDQKQGILGNAILKYKKIFWFALAFSLAINLLTLAMPIYSLQVLDRVVSSGSLETLLMLTLIVGMMFVFLGILTFVRSLVFRQIANQVDENLSLKLLGDALTASCYQKNCRPGQLMREFENIKNFLSGYTMQTLFDAPWAIIFIIAIFFIHYINGLVTLTAAAVLLIMAVLNERSTKQQLEQANEMNIKSLGHIEMSARNSEVVEAMGMKDSIVGAWQKIHKLDIELQLKAEAKANLLSASSKTIRLFIQMLMMGIGAYLVLKNQMSGGGIIATSILAGKALAPFDSAIGTWKTVISVRKSYGKVEDFLNQTAGKESSTLLPEIHGSIAVEKLFFAPTAQHKPIIKAISFRINPGEIIGIIGPSGAGKTTLAKLLVGIYRPSSGMVRLDGIDMSKWDKQKLGPKIGYLPQDIELFKGSIKANISRMADAHDENAVLKAAKLTNAHDIIIKQPGAYETEVGPGGIYLSSGQAQQIGLARTFYGDPKLIVLDEPNAHLDQQGERALLKALAYAKSTQITTIVIAHRKSVLSAVDKIMVLKEGVVHFFEERNKVFSKLAGKA
jgi:ATP-binding cassette, subfamily B, bacterial